MKRIILTALAIPLLTPLLAGCNTGGGGPTAQIAPGQKAVEAAHQGIQDALWAIPADDNPQKIFDEALPILKQHLGPLSDTLKERGVWRLKTLPRRDLARDGYAPHQQSAIDEINEMLQPGKLSSFFPGQAQFELLAWDPTRVAMMSRTQLLLKAVGGSGMARVAMIDNLAPPQAYRLNDDTDAPTIAIVSGPQAVIVHLKREGVAYLPSRLEWLQRADAAPAAPAPQ